MLMRKNHDQSEVSGSDSGVGLSPGAIEIGFFQFILHSHSLFMRPPPYSLSKKQFLCQSFSIWPLDKTSITAVPIL